MVDPLHRRHEHDPDRWNSDDEDDRLDFALSFVELVCLCIAAGLVIALALILLAVA